MSLYKQLWLAVIFLLTLVFSISFVVSSLSAKNYLEQQLYMKNSDNATALALSLTQQDADPILLELTLAAQFDTGFYELIELTNPEGQVTIRREDTQLISDAPGWFMSLLPIEVDPGIAQVQKGWHSLGTLSLRSHSRFAYKELWDGSKKMALVFFFAMLGAGFLGSKLLKVILRPLDDVVDQAEAIGDRRFISIPEPYTREFKQVVSSMNNLSQRIKQMLMQEAKRLEKWQRQAHVDKVTGLLNREPFMQALDAALESDDVNATGSLSLIRLGGLAQLNEAYGRKAIDGMLQDIGAALNGIATSHTRWAAARLNGSDFALLAPRATEPGRAISDAQQAMSEILENHSMLDATSLPAAATIFSQGDSFGGLLTRLDGALLAADKEGESSIQVVFEGDVQAKPVREQMEDWRGIFDSAFRDQNFSLVSHPVIGLQDNLLHYECPVRLEWDGEMLTAGLFLPWVNRLEISLALDKRVVELGLGLIEEKGQSICINLSVAAVVDESFLSWIDEYLAQHSEAAKLLWLEVSESMAFRHLAKFKKLCTTAKAYQCKVGIEHMGHQLSDLGQLHDVGIDYMKIDASFVRDVDTNAGNQTLLRTLCSLGHSIGVIVIGEGVRTNEEWVMLQELGADGGTGPGIQDPS